KFQIRSYEIGVLFLPKMGMKFVMSNIPKIENEIITFPMPFKFPLLCYTKSMMPFIADGTYLEADNFGDVLVDGVVQSRIEKTMNQNNLNNKLTDGEKLSIHHALHGNLPK